MNINTIHTYVLVYLLLPRHWNLIVPVRAGDDGDGTSGLSSGQAGQANSHTVLVNNLYPDFYTTWFSAGSVGSVASESDKEADTGSLLRGSNASGGYSQGSGVLTSTYSGLTSGAPDGSNSGGSSAHTSTHKTGVDLNLTLEEATNEFDYKEEGRYATYIAKDNYAFKLVKDDSTELWKAIDPSEYLSRVEADLLGESKVVTICLSENKTKVFKKDVENDLWTTIDTSKVNPMSVNIDYLDETYFYTNTIDNGVRTFTAKTGFAFKGANEYVDNKVEIWKTDKVCDYANKIEVDLMNEDSKAVTIYFSGNKTKLFMKYGNKDFWTEVDTSKVTPKSLNIKVDHVTHPYYNSNGNYVKTFEARDGFAFNVVKDGSGSNKVDIWKTTNESEYAQKVEFAKRSPDKFDVTIHLIDGKNKLFVKESENDPWKEIDLTKVNPESVNINYEHETHSYKNEYKGYYRKFTAKTGFAFSSAYDYVDDNKVEIWKADYESEYVTRIEYMGGEKLIVYIGDDGTAKVIEKAADGKWPGECS